MNIQGLGILNQIVILITCLTVKMDKGNVVKITIQHNGTKVQGVQPNKQDGQYKPLNSDMKQLI